MKPFVTIDKEVLGGKPVFKGSRVPVYLVLEYLSKDWTIDDIRRKFPTIRREYITRLISTYSDNFKYNGINKEGHNYLG